MIRLYDIVDVISMYNPNADLDLIRKAYVFSAKVHQGQTRRSGEPYLVHPLEVAGILAHMKLDVPSIVAAILHDTVEDTVATLEEVESLFGSEVKELVDGVTKLSKIHFSSKEEQQAENFRKMILAMAKDIRVIVIKLADRLHNMRTLDFLPEHKRVTIAQETQDIYAPIANRLGIQEIKVELEDLSFKYLKPDVYQKIEEGCSEKKVRRDKYIKEVIDIIKKEMSDHDITVQIAGRLKHYFSIWKKMIAQNIPFDQVHDIVAFRIIVDNIQHCYETLGVIHALWRPVPGRFKDYIAIPKANNYQSLHTTVIGPHGERVEFQIRTNQMHDIAEYGIAAHWKYKEGKLVADKDEMKFKWLRRLMEWQKELSDPAEFLDTVKLDLFAEDVYIFTPNGDLKELPHGSTPLDFAYSIHTDLGNTCVGAKVNGKIVPLRYQLRSGDTIEIITQKHSAPHKDWLQFVKTSRAKSKIRQHMRKEEQDQGSAIGKELLDKALNQHGMSLKEVLKSKEFKEFSSKSGYENECSALAAIGYGRLSTSKILNLFGKSETTEQPVKEGPKIQTVFDRIVGRFKKQKDLVRVGGLSDVMISFARCCKPIHGDSIVGFITRGRGVTVHRFDCPRIMEMDPTRRIEVQWTEKTEQPMSAAINVIGVDRPGLLAALSDAIAEQEGNICAAEMRSKEDNTAVGDFEVQVRDVAHLRKIIMALEKINGVISVRRVTG